MNIFEPRPDERFQATDAPPGTRAKVAALADRVRAGHPLWHPEDRTLACPESGRQRKGAYAAET